MTFEPEIPILQVLKSGKGQSPHNIPFYDTMVLKSNSVDDIGVYNMKMIISQD